MPTAFPVTPCGLVFFSLGLNDTHHLLIAAVSVFKCFVLFFRHSLFHLLVWLVVTVCLFVCSFFETGSPGWPGTGFVDQTRLVSMPLSPECWNLDAGAPGLIPTFSFLRQDLSPNLQFG